MIALTYGYDGNDILGLVILRFMEDDYHDMYVLFELSLLGIFINLTAYKGKKRA